MKKNLIMVIITIITVLFSGCSSNNVDMSKLSKDDLQEYTFQESEVFDCMELVCEGKIYRPFCAAEPQNVDKENLIGYYIDDQGNSEYLFKLAGDDSENWLVGVNLGDDGQISGHTVTFTWKATDEKEIPNGLEVEPEYATWN